MKSLSYLLIIFSLDSITSLILSELLNLPDKKMSSASLLNLSKKWILLNFKIYGKRSSYIELHISGILLIKVLFLGIGTISFDSELILILAKFLLLREW